MALKLRTSKGINITVETEPFAKGGEGSVHKVISPNTYTGLCAKIYYPKERNVQRQNKIEHMVHNAPRNLVTQNKIICWPKEGLFEKNSFVGFLMPLAFNNSIQLYELCTPKFNKKMSAKWKQKYSRNSSIGIQSRLKLCTNLSASIHSIHKLNNYTLVDLKPQNALITFDGKISVIDCDSIQISKNNKVIFPARVATPEYVPPEGTRINPSKNPVSLSWDRFSIAVIFYELLFGLHPYTATYSGQYQNCITLDSKIKKGLFVHGKNKNSISVLPKFHQNYRVIPTSLKVLFNRAFEMANQMPDVRPTCEEWGKTIFIELKKNQTYKPVVQVKQDKTSITKSEPTVNNIKKQSMFSNPFSFDGRIRRLEYGISNIIFIIISAIIAVLVDSGIEFAPIAMIPSLWFFLAQSSKRCHDLGNSGWFQLIPLYGFWLLFANGEKGNNTYGLNPKK